MELYDNKFLTGKFLIAMPDMDDERFEKSVIYVCSHGADGAMGFVINKKLNDISFFDLAVPLSVEPKAELGNMFLYQGGPLEKIRGFVLHSTEYSKPGTFKIDSNVAISSTLDILNDIAQGQGPKENLIALGYAGWEPKQLEYELMDNRWLVVPSDKDLIFNTPDEFKWEKAMDEANIDLSRMIMRTGDA